VKSKILKLLTSTLSVVSIGFLSSCSTERSDFDRGYDLGSSDIAKRQYWAQENLQKQKALLKRGRDVRYRTVSLPVYGRDQEGSKISEHYVNVRVIDR